MNKDTTNEEYNMFTLSSLKRKKQFSEVRRNVIDGKEQTTDLHKGDWAVKVSVKRQWK